MIPRIHGSLISLALAQWVSAAPAVLVQRSDLPLVESLPATCDIDLNQIHHDLCILVHSLSEIIDEATLTSPVYQDEHSGIYRADGDSPASAVRLKLSSDTPITERRPIRDLTSFAGRSIKYNTQPSASSSVHFPEHQFSVSVRGTVINLVFLPETPTDQELDSVHVNNGCAHRLTRQLLGACGQDPTGPLKIIASDQLLQKDDVLLKGKAEWKRDKAVDKNINLESGERNVSTTKENKNKQKDRLIDEDASRADEGDDGNPDDGDPVDEEEGERELVPATDRNPWSLTTILFMTSSLLMIAVTLFYIRWQKLVRSYRKPSRFRVGEAALLRWASEDMIFDDEELDTVVIDLATGEEIPLNPSPTKSLVVQYGTTQ